MTAIDVDTSILESLDWEPPCERKGCENQEPARWIDIRYCGCQILKCDPCAAQVRADMPLESNRTCAYCGFWFMGLLGDYIRLEPLT